MRYSNLMEVFNIAGRLAFLVSVLIFFAIQQNARATVLPSSEGTDHGFPYAINPAIPGTVVRTLNVEVKTSNDSYLSSKYRLRGLISETKQKIAFTAMQLFKRVNSIRNTPEKKGVTIESAYVAMLQNRTRNGWPATQELHRSKTSPEGEGPSTSKVNKTKTPNGIGTKVLEVQSKNDTVPIDGARWNQAMTDKENRTIQPALIAQQNIKLENENQTSQSVITGNAHVKMDLSSHTSQPVVAGTERATIENRNQSSNPVIEAQQSINLEIGNQAVEAGGSEKNEMKLDNENQTVGPGIPKHESVRQQSSPDFLQREDMVHASKIEEKGADSNDLEALRSQSNEGSGQISAVDDKGKLSVVSALDLSMPDHLVPRQEKNDSASIEASMHLEYQETKKTRISSEMEPKRSTSGRNSQTLESPISRWEGHAPSNSSQFGNNKMGESPKTEEATPSEGKHESDSFRNVVKQENYNKDGTSHGESSLRPSNKEPFQEIEKEAPSQELKGEISPSKTSDIDKPEPTAEAGGTTEQKLFAGDAELGKVGNKSTDTQKDFIEEAEEGSREEGVLATGVPEGEGETASGENEGPTEKSSEADEQDANGNGKEKKMDNSLTNVTEEGSPISKRQEHSSPESDNVAEAKHINKITNAASIDDSPVNTSMDNTTQLSLMVYKIAKSEEILTMAAAPCREVMGWMPPVVSQLEIELPGLKFYCVDTKEPVGDMKDLKRAFGDISGGFVQASAEEVGQALPRKVDLVVSWMGMQKWGIRKSWRFIKGLKQDGAKFVLLGNNPVSSNSEDSTGTLNVRKAPLLFNEPLRIIGNVSMDDSKQLLLYSTSSLMDSQ